MRSLALLVAFAAFATLAAGYRAQHECRDPNRRMIKTARRDIIIGSKNKVLKYELDDFARVQRQHNSVDDIDPRPIAANSRWGNADRPDREVTALGMFAGGWRDPTTDSGGRADYYQSPSVRSIAMVTKSDDGAELIGMDDAKQDKKGFDTILDTTLNYNSSSATPADIVGSFPASVGTVNLLLDSAGRFFVNNVGQHFDAREVGERTEYNECFVGVVPDDHTIIAADVYDSYEAVFSGARDDLAYGTAVVMFIAQPNSGTLGDRYLGSFYWTTDYRDSYDARGCPDIQTGGTRPMPGAMVISAACPDPTTLGYRYVIGRLSEVEEDIIEVVSVTLNQGGWFGRDASRVVARVPDIDEEDVTDWIPLAITTVPGGTVRDYDARSPFNADDLSTEEVRRLRADEDQHQFALVVGHSGGNTELVVGPVGNEGDSETLDGTNDSDDLIRVEVASDDPLAFTMAIGTGDLFDSTPFILGGAIVVVALGGGGAYSYSRMRNNSSSDAAASDSVTAGMKPAKRAVPSDMGSKGSRGSRGSKRAASSRGSRRSNGSQRRAAPAPVAEV